MRFSRLTFGLLVIGVGIQSASAAKRLIYIRPQVGNPNIKDIVSIATDGSDPQTLHTGLTGLVNVLVDSNAGKLYFRDGASLKSSNLDGSDVQTLGSAPCIAQVSDTALSEDGTKIHAPNLGGSGGVTCGVGTGFLFDWPFNPSVIGSFESVETVPGTGNVFGLTNFCELTSMDHDGNALTKIAGPFPGGFCGSSGLAYDAVGQKLYFVVQDGMGTNFVRTDLDGSNPETLFSTVVAQDLIVDGQNGKLYWLGQGTATAPALGLISANLDGSGETVLADGAQQGFEMADVAGIEPEPIPTVSEWGVATMSLLLLTLGTAVIRQGA